MTLDGVRRGLRSFLETVVLVLMLSLAGIVVVGVLFRKAGASLVWYDEVASILLAWLTFYGAALAALHRGHIGMPTLVAKLQGPMRTAVVLVGEAVTLAFFGVLAWAGFRVLAVLQGTTLVSLPWVPSSVAQSVIPIGAVLFITAQLLSLPRILRGEPLQDTDEPESDESESDAPERQAADSQDSGGSEDSTDPDEGGAA